MPGMWGTCIFRKAHHRGSVAVPDAFVHHKFTPITNQCELKIASYSIEQIAATQAVARGQRLRTLKISLWKFMKKSLMGEMQKTI